MAGLAVHHVAPARALRAARLEDRWDPDVPGAFLSGIQALVRALLDQRRADAAHGVRSAGFVSGYQGSPLGGLDRELARRGELLRELDVTFTPGLNEELAATAVWGAMLAPGLPEARVDGVVGAWFGKNPGLDRAADAIRHATLSGVGPASAAVAIVGDDPAAKSSTIPSAAERTLSGLLVPVLAPASVQDVLDLAGHAFRLSRAAGLWSALKVVADVADATATVAFAPPPGPVERLVDLAPTGRLLAAASLEPERHLVEVRLPAAVAYARAHGLNRVTQSGPGDRIGLVAAGAAYAELRRALADLGLVDAELRRLGVRVFKVDMPWPLDERAVRDFAAGLETVLVVEDKLAFLEDGVRAALYGTATPPAVLGKRDASGDPLLPAAGALGADVIATALAAVLGERLRALPQAAARLDALAHAAAGGALPVARTPAFCSGCPHSTSTRMAPDALVGAGIGCHTMVLTSEGHGDVVGVTQMGGEGAQWIGMAPFTARGHFTQNVGDGTFHHSGSLALRAAVAAGADVTYRLLWNDAVAMTGGQRVEGGMRIPELTRMLEAEGVVRTVITTEDPGRYRGVALAANATVRPREELEAVAAELAALPGVTVLVHDQMCAAEKRRLRRRGTLPEAPERVWINERVCEGCGDCGEASGGCLSVEPVRTEFGRKTRIHQASCNSDLSCLRGDCPSFVTVAAPRARAAFVPVDPPADLPAPPGRPDRDLTVRMVGVGGTGVVTVAQVLAMAAHLEGLGAAGLDQTGLSQKGGPVVSDLRLTAAGAEDAAPHATTRSVDVLLALDLVAAADPQLLAAADPTRTVAVVSDSEVPTAAMVRGTEAPFAPRAGLLRRLGRRTAAVPLVVDAQRVAERALGDHLPANVVLLGAAFQLGLLPVGWDALVRAVELNGTAAEANLRALGWGRAAVAAPEAVAALLAADAPPAHEPRPDVARRVAALALPDGLGALVARRADDLQGYGGRRVVARYLREVARVAALEAERTPGETALTASVARQLHRLLAAKDEYEVARLHLLPEERARRERELGAGAAPVLHLHPPLLRALGLRRKLRLRRSAPPLLHALRAARHVRGTPLDPFGHTALRRLERALPGEYLAGLAPALERLTPRTHAAAVDLSEQAELVRGYETVKLEAVERWRAAVAERRDA